jgi:hypothetical protein
MLICFLSESTVGRYYSNFINSKKNQSQEKKRELQRKGREKQGGRVTALNEVTKWKFPP